MEEDSTSPIPENVSDSLNNTLLNLQHITSHFNHFIAHLPSNPLDRAKSLLTLSRLTTSLFTLKLRCAGIRPEDHRVKAEMDRMSVYQEKLQRLVRLDKAPVRPSTKLNFQAATRVIHHSLPDLSDDQRRSFKALGKNESGRVSAMERSMQKKRKYDSPLLDKTSVRAAAQEFLEKAARELLGDKQEGFRGPIAPTLIQDSSDEEEQEANEVEEEAEEEEEEQCLEVDVLDRAACVSTTIVIDGSDGN